MSVYASQPFAVSHASADALSRCFATRPPGAVSFDNAVRILPTVPDQASRILTHPIRHDRITFLKTARENNETQVEMELGPGSSGSGFHYHRLHSERFTALDGALEMQIGKKKRTLHAGESVTIQPGTMHRFSNPSHATVRFLVQITPGSDGFENALYVGCGLARDKTNAEGIFETLLCAALLREWSDTRTRGPLVLLGPLFFILTAIGRKCGLDADLIVRYVPHAFVGIAN